MGFARIPDVSGCWARGRHTTRCTERGHVLCWDMDFLYTTIHRTLVCPFLQLTCVDQLKW